MMKRNLVLSGMGLLALAVVPVAHASLLAPPLVTLEPGGFYLPGLPNDTTDHNGNDPIGTLVASTGVEAISNTSASGFTLTGSFISEVYMEAGGTLDFYYQVSVASGSTSSLEDLDVSSFLASSIGTPNGVITGETGNVALFGTSGVPGACGFGANPACTAVTLTGANRGTVVPSFGVAYVDDVPLTGTLNFDWDGAPLSRGKTSVALAVSTNDTLFELGATSLDGSGGTAQDLFSFQPLAAISEPGSIVLLGTTLALAALLIRRRHVANPPKAETKA